MDKTNTLEGHPNDHETTLQPDRVISPISQGMTRLTLSIKMDGIGIRASMSPFRIDSILYLIQEPLEVLNHKMGDLVTGAMGGIPKIGNQITTNMVLANQGRTTFWVLPVIGVTRAGVFPGTVKASEVLSNEERN